MIKNLIPAVLLTATILACGCQQQKSIAKTLPDPNLIPAANFDTVIDGKKVGLHTLRNGLLTMQTTNFGGRVVSLFVPNNDTILDIVVGHNTIREYTNYIHERYLGACVGPVANRIVGASFSVDGQIYKLSANHGGTGTLHGGFKGLDSQVWDVKAQTDSTITYHFLHADGMEGFPGNCDIDMTYSLTNDGSWRIDYLATTDQTRPVNISNHPYFNLAGGEGLSLDYIIQINGDSITGLDGANILEPASIVGTEMDYRQPHAVRDAVESPNEQMRRGNHGFDHNYVVNLKPEQDTTFVASVLNPDNGLCVEVFSDQPGLQVYSGQYWKGTEIGKNGKTIDRNSSFTYETQHYPDSPNHPSFPDTFLRPGEEYHHTCIYRFSTKK
ncbi:MAG: aldose epimerase family protein [Bacteroidales bacterium]|nr:aldose epimerase family protein [Bacteroidales bacterium]